MFKCELPWIRCDCGKPIGSLWEQYKKLRESGISPEEAMNKVGAKRYCCRQALMNPIQIEAVQQEEELVEGLKELEIGIGKPYTGGLLRAMQGETTIAEGKEPVLLPTGPAAKVIKGPPPVKLVRSSIRVPSPKAPVSTLSLARKAPSPTVTTPPAVTPSLTIPPSTVTPSPIELVLPPALAEAVPPSVPTPVPPVGAQVHMVAVGSGYSVPVLPTRVYYAR